MINFIARLFCKSESRSLPLTPIQGVEQTLKAIDRLGGYGFSVTPSEMFKLINGNDESFIRKKLAFSLIVSESDLCTAMKRHLRKGGSIFSCIGIADMQLAEPQ
jgi:hypothetical protein